MENKMSTSRKQGERVPKKPYVKPELKKVPLRPDEAVLGGCKVDDSSPGVGSTCGIGFCSIAGS